MEILLTILIGLRQLKRPNACYFNVRIFLPNAQRDTILLMSLTMNYILFNKHLNWNSRMQKVNNGVLSTGY